jgi:hypothetical protein
MNIDLLQQIKSRILAEPDAFRMDYWSCGTAHCIGGWACVLSGYEMQDTDSGIRGARLTNGFGTMTTAGDLLGLSFEDTDGWETPSEAERLFFTENWPQDFEDRYDAAEAVEDRAELAKIAAERIDHFIATNGAE